MRRTLSVALAAPAVAAALCLPGCAPQASTPVDTTLPAPPSTTTTPPHDPGLPDPGALTDVLYRLADPAVPGAEKVVLVQGAAEADAETLDRFAAALRDNGYRPATFTADDLVWSAAGPPDGVVADVTIAKNGEEHGFSLPMEFDRTDGQWQLSHDTFDMLLGSGPGASDSPGPPEPESPEPEAPEPPG